MQSIKEYFEFLGSRYPISALNLHKIITTSQRYPQNIAWGVWLIYKIYGSFTHWRLLGEQKNKRPLETVLWTGQRHGTSVGQYFGCIILPLVSLNHCVEEISLTTPLFKRNATSTTVSALLFYDTNSSMRRRYTLKDMAF